jgi:AraC-like DNA-binding protein
MDLTTIIHTLLFIGSAQGLLLSIALLTVPRRNLTANRLLAVLLLLFTILIIMHVRADSLPEYAQNAGSPRHAEIPLLLFGPLFFLYTRAMTQESFRLAFKDLMHLIPFVLGLALTLLAWALQPGDLERRVLGGSILVLMTSQITVYLFFTLRLVMRFQSTIRDTHSSLERISLRWLWFITIAFFVIWPVAFIVELFKEDPDAFDIVWLLIAIFMYLLGYMSLRQREVFGDLPTEEDIAPAAERSRYEKSRLSEEDAAAQYRKLLDLMVSGRLYLDPNLTLSSLAHRMGLSIHHLSQIINQRGGCNFFEFVNTYRVEESRRLLEDSRSEHLTIAAVGFEAGFSSVSSFNSIFKKMSGSTPSQYRSVRRGQK